MKETENKIVNSNKVLDEKTKKELEKKKKLRAETSKFKSKYFEYYDDIKISDRQDW